MPRVDFYVLGDAGAQAQHRQACKLAEEAVDAGASVYIRTGSAAESQSIDDLLWTFSDRAFLPHEVATAGSPSHAKIAALIGTGPAPAGFRSLLINTSDEIPADAADFERIAEVVNADPGRKQQARDRFRQYRERGWAPESHTV